MKLESQKINLEKSAQDVFNFLSAIENFKQLMPENISKFEVLDTDKFLFALSGMPEIVLKKKSFNLSTLFFALVIFVCFRESLNPFTIPWIMFSVGFSGFLLMMNGFLIFKFNV